MWARAGGAPGVPSDLAGVMADSGETAISSSCARTDTQAAMAAKSRSELFFMGNVGYKFSGFIVANMGIRTRRVNVECGNCRRRTGQALGRWQAVGREDKAFFLGEFSNREMREWARNKNFCGRGTDAFAGPWNHGGRADWGRCDRLLGRLGSFRGPAGAALDEAVDECIDLFVPRAGGSGGGQGAASEGHWRSGGNWPERRSRRGGIIGCGVERTAGNKPEERGGLLCAAGHGRFLGAWWARRRPAPAASEGHWRSGGWERRSALLRGGPRSAAPICCFHSGGCWVACLA